MELGDLIRARRRALCWTQARLARAAGTSRVHVAAVESGRSQPSLTVFAALVRALGIEPAEALQAAQRGRAA